MAEKLTWTNEKRKLGDLQPWLTCIDCGAEKNTVHQQKAPRCHVCENKRRSKNIIYYACPICGKPKIGRGRSDRVLCKVCAARARWRSMEFRNKISAAARERFGEIHWEYVGFTEEVQEFVRERHDRKCAICGTPENGKKLDVHHINYDKTNSKPENLIALCHSCHMRTNNNRKYWEKFIYEILS